MKKVVIFYILALCATMHSVMPIYANDASMGRTPEGVYLMNNDQIAMTSEDIKIYPFKGFAECTFEFINYGEATEILMGFPATLKEDLVDPIMQDIERTALKDFTAADESGSIEVKLEKGTPKYDDSNYSLWYTFKVKFNKGEKKVIRNTYSFENTYYSNGDISTGYIIDTGAGWKDKIGHAKVTFFTPDTEAYEITSLRGDPYFSLGDGVIIWERYDFEPAKNIEILINTILSEEHINRIDDHQYKDSLLELKGKLEILQSSIFTMDRDSLIKEFFDPQPVGLDSYGYSMYGLRLLAFQRFSELEAQTDNIIGMRIGNNSIFVNGTIQTFEPEGGASAVPEIKYGRTFVPIRFIVENMGGDIEWDEQLRQITIKNKGKTIVMNIGEKSILEDGLKKEIDAAPEIINGRTIVPIRFVAESMGLAVEWCEDKELVLISGKK
ncbi:MAG: copper amine oxidase N-terminal domain-containing protein [Clostridiaceae bacterium]|nr:copper amine oxidase N-terminal domain-containing protein [Clostridiaceae bacterium]